MNEAGCWSFEPSAAGQTPFVSTSGPFFAVEYFATTCGRPVFMLTVLKGGKVYDPAVNWATNVDMKTGRPQVVAKYSTAKNGPDVNTKGVCPAALGSKDEQPAAFSPKTNRFYIPTNHVCMAANYVKASGGCSAPAGKDALAARASLGKMRIRVEDANASGKPVLAQLMISHPNDSGLAMDQVTRTYAQPHFVRQVDVSYAGKPVMNLVC